MLILAISVRVIMMASNIPEVNREHRAYIKIMSLLGNTPRNIFNDFQRVYASEECSEFTVKKWSLLFREWRAIGNEPRARRPVAATTSNNILKVSKLIEEEPQITVNNIDNHLDLSSGVVQEVLSSHLVVRKVFLRKVPHLLSESQKRARLNSAINLQKIMAIVIKFAYSRFVQMKPGYAFWSLYGSNRTSYGSQRLPTYCMSPSGPLGS